MNILSAGAGTGQSIVDGHIAQIYKEKPSVLSQFSVIHSVFDDGGHSGSIVRELGLFGPGDARKLILALSQPWLSSDTYKALSRRDWYPLEPGQSEAPALLHNAPVGNMAILAGMLKYGRVDPGRGLLNGIKVFAEMCHMPEAFQVMPVSLDQATLSADLADGSTIVGQSAITKHLDHGPRRIVSLRFAPAEGMQKPKLYEGAREAILRADKIVISPGSFWTSIWPNMLVEGFLDALAETKAKIIMVVNLVTESSESSRWSSGQFVGKLHHAIGRSFDAVLYHDWEAEIAEWKRKIQERRLPEEEEQALAELLSKYDAQEFYPVMFPRSALPELTKTRVSQNIVRGRFAEWDGRSFKHNRRMAEAILGL